MKLDTLNRLQDRIQRNIVVNSQVGLFDAGLDVTTMYTHAGTPAKLKPDQYKAYIDFYLAHAFPVVSSYKTSFHPTTLRNSFQSMLHQQFNYGHLVRHYYKGKPEEDKVREDRILGSIIAVDFPKEPLGGWQLTSAEEAPGMHCVATIAKQAKGMDKVLGSYQAGRQNWTVSLEVDYQLSESGVVIIPTQTEKRGALGGASREYAISDEDMSILAKHTPEDFKRAGLWYLPLIEASDELVDCFSAEKGTWSKKWKGCELVTIMGGLDGQIAFKGTGLVQYGAEPTARIDSILAHDKSTEALSEGIDKLSASLDRLFGQS